MSAAGDRLPSFEARVSQMRSEFDNAFALPVAKPQTDGVELLILSAGGQTYAVRTSELAGVEVDRKIVPLPSARPGLLGLCAAQGELAPVFELAAVLGGPPANAAPRWLALHRDQELVALAFDELRESRRLGAAEFSPLELAPGHGALSRYAIQHETGVIHVLDIPAIISTLRQSRQGR